MNKKVKAILRKANTLIFNKLDRDDLKYNTQLKYRSECVELDVWEELTLIESVYFYTYYELEVQIQEANAILKAIQNYGLQKRA